MFVVKVYPSRKKKTKRRRGRWRLQSSPFEKGLYAVLVASVARVKAHLWMYCPENHNEAIVGSKIRSDKQLLDDCLRPVTSFVSNIGSESSGKVISKYVSKLYSPGPMEVCQYATQDLKYGGCTQNFIVRSWQHTVLQARHDRIPEAKQVKMPCYAKAKYNGESVNSGLLVPYQRAIY